MKKVAVIGTRGVPASYGGFESLVENLIGDNCPPDIHYTVFCSASDMTGRAESYKGADLRYVPLHANGIQSIPYDMLSMCRVLRGYDVILILGVSGCLALPVLRRLTRARIIVNIDGLEHKRQKWGGMARRVLLASERAAVRHADVIVADNRGIADYVRDAYGIEAALIAYGGDQVCRSVSSEAVRTILDRYGVSAGGYAMSLCRIEPENNCDMILEAFAENSGMPLLFVGNWHHSEYASQLRERYEGHDGIIIADAEYDLDVLWALRSNAAVYVHGHSAGGTNPSLVEAMHAGVPVAAFDVNYNRYTTAGNARYFSDVTSLREAVAAAVHSDGVLLKQIAGRDYTWARIASLYVNLFRDTR